MLTKVPFKRVVRRFNKCFSITLPKDIAESGNVQAGQEFEFTILINFPDDNDQKEKSVIAPMVQ